MQTVSYSRVLEYLQSLAGIDAFDSTEKACVRSAFNRRVRMAYEESQYWPNFVKEELRYAGLDNVLPEDQAGKDSIDVLLDVQSASPRNNSTGSIRYDTVRTVDGWKLLGLEDGDQDEVVYTVTPTSQTSGESADLTQRGSTIQAISFWFKADAPTSYGTGSASTNLLTVNNSATGLTFGDSAGGLLLSIDNATSTAMLRNTWIVPEGYTMQVYIDGTSVGFDYGAGDVGINIQGYFDGQWHNAIWTLQPSETYTQNISEFYYELNGTANQDHTINLQIADVRLLVNKVDAAQAFSIWQNAESVYNEIAWSSTLPEYWCSFKKQLSTTYGDQVGDTTIVPIEFFEYGVHGAYADWLRSEGQTDKAMAEEQFAQMHLNRQLERIHFTNLSPYLWSRFSTHGTRQRR